MKKLIEFLSKYIGLLAITILLLFVQAQTDLALPDYMSDIINDGILGSNQTFILRTGFKMILVTFIGAAASIAVGYIAAWVAASVSRDMRLSVFDKVQSFSNAEFDKFSTASLITRTTNDITQIQTLLVLVIRLVFYAPILGAGGIIKALENSASMSWIIAIAVLVLIGVIMILFVIAMPKFQLVQKLVDRLNLVTRENLDGMMVVRAFNAQSFEKDRFDVANRELTEVNLFVNRSIATMMPIMMLVMNLTSVVIVWVGAKQVSSLHMDIGNMMAYMQFGIQIIMAFLMLAMMFILVPRAAVSANRIAEVLDAPLSILDPESPAQMPEKSELYPEVVFENVTFAYPEASEPVLHHISFTAKPGETTAFIGSTGCGKSTLVSLLMRFYDVSEGTIEIDGKDIRTFSKKDLRSIIGYVPQKSLLFSGTIESNLYYGDRNASPENIEKSAQIAQATEFIMSKPEGYQYPIAQGGGNVSGGQKQRLSIARALVKNAPIYIFDDSFSALDLKTDRKLREALAQGTENSTILLVAQRVSTILNAEKIIVLDNGKIVGQGTHKDLLKTCPIYYDIASSQLSEEELTA